MASPPGVEMVDDPPRDIRVYLPCRRKISCEQAQLCKTWLACRYDQWKGKWPKAGEWEEDINMKLAEIGISKEQANRQLLVLRVERNDVCGFGEVCAGSGSLRVADYTTLLAKSIDSTQIRLDALIYLEEGSFFEFRPTTSAPFKRASEMACFPRCCSIILLIVTLRECS